MSSSGKPLSLTVALVVAAFFGLWLWQSGREDRSLRALPEAERHALYTRTLETVRTSCDPKSSFALTDFCAQQADLVLRFDDCDDSCRQLAHSLLQRRSR